MPGENIQDWSITAANNATADTSINWAEGQPRASVNNSARSMMAAFAKDRNLKNGSITTGGTANAQTFTSGIGYTVVPTGLWVKLKVGVTNTGATTLNMDGIGAVAVKDQSGSDLGAGALTLGRYIDLIYDGTNWKLMQAVGATTVPQCGRLTRASATALSFAPYNGDLIKIDGNTYPVPSAGIAGLGNTGVLVDGGAGNLVADTLYLVFAKLVGGVITGHFYTASTPPTTANHAPSTQAGNVGTEILTYSGAELNALTLIGMVRTNASAQFADDVATRNVISWFNRTNKPLMGVSTNGAITTSGPVVELLVASRVYYVTWGTEAVSGQLWGTLQTNSGPNGGLYLNLSGDGVALIPQSSLSTHTNAFDWAPAAGSWCGYSTEGAHYFTPAGASAGPGVYSGIYYVGVSGFVRG